MYLPHLKLLEFFLSLGGALSIENDFFFFLGDAYFVVNPSSGQTGATVANYSLVLKYRDL